MTKRDNSPPKLSVLQRLKRRPLLFARMWRALRLFGPMLADVLRGRYRPVPWAAILWMTGAGIYLLSPLDVIPDFLLIIGLLDDVVIVGWMLTQVDKNIAAYRLWFDEGRGHNS
ncbi:YkvA family protein [Halomonas halocynthiae]|uniref:YkvA family protein n=1 Tax=Halomonas halocynthiae TaxID=176290 RepID=UPI000403139C|nr:YkvA family protein [Halomonas halocynthiae]